MRKLLLVSLLFAINGCIKIIDNENNDDGCPFVFRDFTNHTIAVSVVDTDGNDLLDPQIPGNLRENEITITYRGMIFDANDPQGKNPEPPSSRFNMPHWNGLKISEFSGRYYVLFGEFSPGANYRDATYTIDWGDGTSDKISFDLYLTWHNCEPTVHRGLKINDQPVEGGWLTGNIVKNRD